jgi:hypothetical protein
MPFTPGNTLGQGRPKGSPNKENLELRNAIQAIVNGAIPDVVSVLAEMRETNPVKYTENVLKLMEYVIPKMRSVDNTISVDPEYLGSIKIEVITKEKLNEGTKHTSDGSIPEELPSN